jgi:para-aminobenzoate synthetase
MLANRIVSIDHLGERTTILAVARTDDLDQQQEWISTATNAVEELLDTVAKDALAHDDPPPERASGHPGEVEQVVFRCGRGRERYLADIARCQSEMAAGESYEVCLTDQIHTDASPDPFSLYRRLRRRNPAPFSAYLRLGEIAIASSSPERFIGMDRNRKVQARPIKGTAPRSSDPLQDAANRDFLQNDEKTFAEHLMIVDLLRSNDLGRRLRYWKAYGSRSSWLSRDTRRFTSSFRRSQACSMRSTAPCSW